MAYTIDKCKSTSQVKEPIYETVASSLRRQIGSGKLCSGDRIPSERELAQQWGISRGTARLALKELENYGYIERQGARGSFIRNAVASSQTRRVVLAFPEKAISPEALEPENWAYSSEIFRGLIAGGVQNDMQVFFEHFQDEVSETEQRRQLERLRGYDVAVFVGAQLNEIQQEFAVDHTVIRIVDLNVLSTTPVGILAAGFDGLEALKILVGHMVDCGCCSAGALSFNFDDSRAKVTRSEQFMRLAAERGVYVPESFNFHFTDRKGLKTQFDRMLAGPLPNFIFCNHAEYIIDFYQAAYRNSVEIGRNCMIGGIATGLTFKGLIPSYTYVRVPMFEIGEIIMKTLAENSHPASIPFVSPILVTGNSTVPVVPQPIPHQEEAYV